MPTAEFEQHGIQRTVQFEGNATIRDHEITCASETAAQKLQHFFDKLVEEIKSPSFTVTFQTDELGKIFYITSDQQPDEPPVELSNQGAVILGPLEAHHDEVLQRK